MNARLIERPLVAMAALAFLLVAAPLLTAQTMSAGQGAPVKIDLNTATQADLEHLPGIDPATATRIIEGRPYSAVSDLSKSGVSARTIEEITPLVKVGPMGKVAGETGKGVDKAAAGVKTGADATVKGVEKGVDAASKGVEKGASATASAVGAADRKLTGAARTPPQAGMVWADSATKVYHLAGDPSYGATKKGKWLTRQEAVKRGYRPAKPDAPKEE
jgi:hypothetical protein